MAPGDVGTDGRSGPVVGGAFAFLSKSISDVQKSAESDIKLMKSRVKSIKDFSETLDKEWESIKIPAVTNLKNSGRIFKTITDTGSKQSGSVSAVSSPFRADFNFLKSLKPTLSEFRHSFSDPDFQSHSSRVEPGKMDLWLRKPILPKDSELGLDLFSLKPRDGLRNEWAQSRKVGDRRVTVRDWHQGAKRKKANRKQKPSVDDWVDDWVLSNQDE